MATGSPIRELCDEVTCPICLDYFKNPVTIAECGHNFCQDCLLRSWMEVDSCPVCKQNTVLWNLQPNRQLANIVEITKKLSLQQGNERGERKEEAKERICEKHGEPLKLFCQNDEILICKGCEKSKKHKNHEVIPTEEASQKYKDKIFRCLETLKTERGKILVYIADTEDKSQKMLNITESERQERMSEFRTLQQLLKGQEKHLLVQIVNTEKEIARKRDEKLTILTKELSCLENLIWEMEKKIQQPESELLKDVRDTLQRYEKKFENPDTSLIKLKQMVFGNEKDNPEAFLFNLKQRTHDCQYNSFLQTAMKQFRDSLAWAFPKLRATVTLDPASASSGLVLSCLYQRVITAQEQSEDPEQHYGFVLGSEGFTAGCHFWEISVGNEEGWAVGVARKPVKGKATLTPEEGIWAVGRWKGLYKAFIKSTDPPLMLRGELRKIRVCLNYAGGRVAFFDADRAALLYEFSGASFSGQTLVPFFAVYGHGWLWLYP